MQVLARPCGVCCTVCAWACYRGAAEHDTVTGMAFFFFFFYPKQHNPEQMVRVAPAGTRVERDPNERCVSCDKLD